MTNLMKFLQFTVSAFSNHVFPRPVLVRSFHSSNIGHEKVRHCYRPQTKLRKGYVFTPACWDTPPGQTPPLDRHDPGQTPPPLQTATAADSTPPTGMHSCERLILPHFLWLVHTRIMRNLWCRYRG